MSVYTPRGKQYNMGKGGRNTTTDGGFVSMRKTEFLDTTPHHHREYEYSNIIQPLTSDLFSIFCSVEQVVPSSESRY